MVKNAVEHVFLLQWMERSMDWQEQRRSGQLTVSTVQRYSVPMSPVEWMDRWNVTSSGLPPAVQLAIALAIECPIEWIE